MKDSYHEMCFLFVCLKGSSLGDTFLLYSKHTTHMKKENSSKP